MYFSIKENSLQKNTYFILAGNVRLVGDEGEDVLDDPSVNTNKTNRKSNYEYTNMTRHDHCNAVGLGA